MNDLMQEKLEIRLAELKQTLEELSPKSATQGPSIDHWQMQIYILGFQDASQIALKEQTKPCEDCKHEFNPDPHSYCYYCTKCGEKVEQHARKT